MISFLLEEGVLTVGTLSGLFTTALLNSLKRNVIDPSIDKVFPPHTLDNTPTQEKSGFSDLFPIPTGGGNEPPQGSPASIKWQTFLKDFITWLVIMFCLYLFWKKVLHPIKVSKVV
jgi:large-conductance mechanosensitive channel